MQSQPRSKRPPRTPWPRWAAGLAALLLSGAACADMVGGLLVSPTSLNFGSVALGATSASQQVTVTNTTSAPIGPLSVGSGVSAPWGSGTGCSGVTLAAGTSCSSTYTFTPTALGPQVSSEEGITINGVKVPMSFVGTGVQGLRVTPTSFNFGDVIVNTTSPGQVLTVTNITSAPVTIASSSAGAMAPFAYSGNCPGITLASGASCTYTYTFLPTTLGARATPAGTEFVVNGQATPISLQGTGVASIPPGSLLVTPSAFDFGDVPIGSTSVPQAVTVTNPTGAAIALNLSGGGTGAAPFNTFQGDCGASLAAGSTCTLRNFSFSPIATGSQTDGAAIQVNGVSYTFSVSGIGINAGQSLIAPVITSAPPPGGTAGAPYNFIVTATGTTVFTFSDAGTLPPGLTINPSTGAITGTPSAAGSYNVTLAAANGILPNGAQAFTMDIALAPVGSVTAVPTLGEWGLLLMACLVGGTGWWQVRRRSTSRWPAP